MTALEQVKEAKAAAPILARTDTRQKNRALLAMAEALEAESRAILQENILDQEAAGAPQAPGLALKPERIRAMADGIRRVAELPDPVGRVRKRLVRPNGMVIEQVGVPLGVIAVIYESRPDVTSEAAAMAVKAGSACVLRCGRQAFRTAQAIVQALQTGLEAAGLPAELVQLVREPGGEGDRTLMTAVGHVDLLIPRGGAGLVRACMENAKVPCIQTGIGLCHIYVDREADQAMALRIIEHAKTSSPSAGSAEEVLLVHRDIAAEFLPKLRTRLVTDRMEDGRQPVELRLDRAAAAIIDGTPAGEQDFDTEFLDYILAVGVVADTRQAMDHIAAHSTGHSEAIVTGNPQTAELFLRTVDSAAVYHNCSTRLTDGEAFGLGCEMGFSTQKLHARGPLGLEELTTYQYVIRGTGQVR